MRSFCVRAESNRDLLAALLDPAFNASLAATKPDDEAWFAANPGRLYRLRPANAAEAILYDADLLIVDRPTPGRRWIQAAPEGTTAQAGDSDAALWHLATNGFGGLKAEGWA